MKKVNESRKYHLKSSSQFSRFEFVSEGPKGTILKLTEFQDTNILHLVTSTLVQKKLMIYLYQITEILKKF